MRGDLRTLRGEPLARLARELEELRPEGKACWRCDRLLAGGACPEHGRTGPPRMRAAAAPQGVADGRLRLLSPSPDAVREGKEVRRDARRRRLNVNG